MALVTTPVPGNAGRVDARVECTGCPASTIVANPRPRRLRRMIERLGQCPSCGK